MSDYFFITGLPRSRTSWLSNLFTYGSSFCFHDLIKKRQTAQEIAIAMADVGRDHVGNSDCGMVMVGDELDELLEPKWIFVRRNRGDVVRSYVEYFTAHPYPQFGPPSYDKVAEAIEAVEPLMLWLINLIPPHRKRVVYYESLDDVSVIRSMWNFIVPEEPFDHLRFELLDCLLINPASRKVKVTHGNKAMDSVLAA